MVASSLSFVRRRLFRHFAFVHIVFFRNIWCVGMRACVRLANPKRHWSLSAIANVFLMDTFFLVVHPSILSLHSFAAVSVWIFRRLTSITQTHWSSPTTARRDTKTPTQADNTFKRRLRTNSTIFHSTWAAYINSFEFIQFCRWQDQSNCGFFPFEPTLLHRAARATSKQTWLIHKSHGWASFIRLHVPSSLEKDYLQTTKSKRLSLTLHFRNGKVIIAPFGVFATSRFKCNILHFSLLLLVS